MQRTTIPYFLCTLMLFAGLKTHSQTPGGIPVKAWYRADAAITLFSDAGSTPVSNNGTVYQWNDFTGNGFHLIQTSSGSRPVFSTTTLANFNPTVTFDGSNDWLQYTAPAGVNIIDRATGTLYASGYMKTQKRSGFLGFNQTMDYPGLHFYSSFKTLLYTSGGPGYQGLTNNAMTPNTYFFTGGTWQNDGGNPNFLGATVSLNGDRKTYLGSEMNNVNLGTSYRDLRIGADNNYGAFSGQLNELMVFEDRLTPSELDQLESYLAIKYGTTFASGTLNYKNSVGATVWDASANNGYHFNIAGIARDDNGELYQKQSWSTNSGYQVLIGVGPLANTNSDNPGTLTDGQYLIWGDNGLEKAPTVVTGDFPGISHIFPAIWKVQNTGNVGSVRVAWPKTLTGLALIQSSDAIFNGSDLMTSMASNEITINGVIYNYADVVLTDGSYFTFGAKLSAPGGVTTGLIMWHKADDGTAGSGQKDTWRDMSGNNRHVAQNNNANYRPLYITDANYAANSKNFFFNFNPFYYFDGTNDFFYRQSDDYFTTSNSPGSAYSVVQSSAATGHRTLFGWGDDDPNLVKYYEYYDVWRDNGRVIHENLGVSAFPALMEFTLMLTVEFIPLQVQISDY
jgi:hypothetical protein